MSVSVALQAVWLNALLVPSDCIAIPSVTGLVDEPDTGGKVATYAGGRQRAVQSEGTSRKYTLTLTLATASVWSWLEAHKGQVVVARDFTGLRDEVTFFSWSRSPRSFANRHDFSNLYLYATTGSDVV